MTIVWWIDWFVFSSAKVEETFDNKKLFEIVASGDVDRLRGLKDYLSDNKKTLSDTLCK